MFKRVRVWLITKLVGKGSCVINVKTSGVIENSNHNLVVFHGIEYQGR